MNPGTPAQIGVVREVIARLGADVPVGARVAGSERDDVSPFHHDWLGDVPPARAGETAHELLARVLTGAPDTVL